MPNSYLAEVINPNLDIWRPNYPWLDKGWNKCKLYTNTWGTKVLHICCTSVLGSQILVCFALLATFLSYRLCAPNAYRCTTLSNPIGRFVHRMTPKDLEHKVKASPYVFISPKLQFRFMTRYRQIWDKCTEGPQKGLGHYKAKGTPYICYQCPRVPHFTPFYSTTNSFRDTKLSIIRNAPNDLRMTLNT